MNPLTNITFWSIIGLQISAQEHRPDPWEERGSEETQGPTSSPSTEVRVVRSSLKIWRQFIFNLIVSNRLIHSQLQKLRLRTDQVPSGWHAAVCAGVCYDEALECFPGRRPETSCVFTDSIKSPPQWTHIQRERVGTRKLCKALNTQVFDRTYSIRTVFTSWNIYSKSNKISFLISYLNLEKTECVNLHYYYYFILIYTSFMKISKHKSSSQSFIGSKVVKTEQQVLVLHKVTFFKLNNNTSMCLLPSVNQKTQIPPRVWCPACPAASGPPYTSPSPSAGSPWTAPPTLPHTASLTRSSTL